MRVENTTKTIFEFRGKKNRCIQIDGNWSMESFMQLFRANGFEISPTDFTGEYYVRKGDEFPRGITVEMWINDANKKLLFHERNAKQLYEITRFKKA